jgi:hypothetical protein
MAFKRDSAATLLVILVLVLAGLACRSTARDRPDVPPGDRVESAPATATPTSLPSSAPAATQPPQATATAVAAAPTATQPPGDAPGGQSPLEVAQIPELEVTTLDPRGTPLGQLGTFRQRMRAEFVAPESVYNGTYSYEAEVNTAQQAVHLVVTAEGAAAQQFPANRVEAIWIGPQLWVKLGNRRWVPVPEDVAEAQFDEQTVSVGQFLPYVPNFDRIQPDETVNGIPSARYAYDVQDVPSEYGTVDARGQIWVALDGGYVVRYTLEATGQFSEHFQGTGTLKLTYDTYDVGQQIAIQAPRR